MNIGLLTATSPELRQRRDATDLSKTRADGGAGTDAVASEAIAAPKPRPIGNQAPSTRFASMRAALDARIAADTASGVLPADDAVAVRSTLDAIDGQAGGAVVAGHWTRIAAYDGSRSYPVAGNAQQAARLYLATIARGTLVDRIA